MKNLILAATVICCAFNADVSGSAAWAQSVRRPGIRRYQNMNSQPLVDPSLNLIRGGADPGFNYFTLVQPQYQQQQYNQTQSRQLQGLNREVQQQSKVGPYGAVGGIRPTGGRGAATYRNYSHYYPGAGAGGTARSFKGSSGAGAGGMGMGMGMF